MSWTPEVGTARRALQRAPGAAAHAEPGPRAGPWARADTGRRAARAGPAPRRPAATVVKLTPSGWQPVGQQVSPGAPRA